MKTPMYLTLICAVGVAGQGAAALVTDMAGDEGRLGPAFAAEPMGVFHRFAAADALRRVEHGQGRLHFMRLHLWSAHG